jgi:hypothetical protein
MVPNALSRRRSTVRVAPLFALVTVLAAGGCTDVAADGRQAHRGGGPAASNGTRSDNTPPRARSCPASVEPALEPAHELVGALHGRTGAYLTVGAAASRVDIRAADLPGVLYCVSTPARSGLTPRVTGPAGRVRVGLRPTGADGPDTVTILLSRVVRWDIRLPAGAGEQRIDLAGGRLARLQLGGAGLVDLRLPRPSGTVPVTLADSAGSVAIATPPATAVRVRLRGGAGAVVTPWSSGDGALPRGVLTAPRWGSAADRYAVDARAALGSLTLR